MFESDETNIQQKKIEALFFPYATKKLEAIRKFGRRFVHYTSAEVAANILSKKEVWMRNATTMNDYMEVEHGFQCLRSAYDGEAGKQLNHVVDSVFPALSTELRNRFNGWLPTMRKETYLTSISEHRHHEDRHGRLSMWRAYGGSTGVALVLNNTVFLNESEALKAYTSPVAYLDPDSFTDEFRRVATAIESERDLLYSIGQEQLLNLLFQVFHFSVLCTKHPGFREEREWRIIYSPSMERSPHMLDDVYSVRGVPQKIHKIPLKNIPEHSLVGAEIPELIERIIIGPTDYPNVVYQAFQKLLSEAGVQNPEERIFVSDIPLREYK